jgi:type IV secretory pathway VirB3-like protein
MKKLRFKNIVSGGTIGIAATITASTNFFAHYGIESVMLFTLSGALVYGPIYGFIIGASIMVIADFMVGLVGLWTLYTAFAYGFVGFLAGVIGMFKKKFTRAELVGLVFVLAIIFDAISMTAFAFQFGIPLSIAVINQIPVTLNRIVSNALLAFVFAPALMKIINIISDPMATEGLLRRMKMAKEYAAEGLINLGNSLKRVVSKTG